VTTIVETIPLLLSVREAAEISGISRSELYRRIESGVLRTRLVGGVMRIHRDDLFAMIEALPCVGG
jgi:excisionase family DNA binding protein